MDEISQSIWEKNLSTTNNIASWNILHWFTINRLYYTPQFLLKRDTDKCPTFLHAPADLMH